VERLRRVLLYIVGALVGLAAIALLVVNLYVQSQGTQARIQRELSQRLNTPLHIRSISITPWGGLTLSGITIPQTSAGVSGDFLEARSFHLHVRLSSLFSQRLIVKEVSLFGPTVVWAQDEDGKWRLPGARGEKRGEQRGENASTVAAPSSAPTASAPASPESAVSSSAPASAAASPVTEANNPPVSYTPEVQRVNLTGGDFRFLDRAGNEIAAFEGVRFHSSFRNSQALRGIVKIEKISLRNRFFLQNLESFLHYDSEKLDLPKISAQAAGGVLHGSFKMKPESPGSPFSANVNFSGVEADQLVSDAGGPKGILRGKLEGNFQGDGKTAEPDALTGKGSIVLHDGTVQQYSLLVALGQVLQIEELTQLQLQQAELKYRIASGLVTIDELVLRSPNIRLSATGTLDFSGKLDLNSELAINEKIRRQLFKPIRENFEPIAEQGYSAVDFHVGGTLDRPRTNLMEKIVGRDIQDFVSGFLGTKPRRRKKEKRREAEEPATPDQEASPAEHTTGMPAANATPP
jgi:type II secretion system protein N